MKDANDKAKEGGASAAAPSGGEAEKSPVKEAGKGEAEGSAKGDGKKADGKKAVGDSKKEETPKKGAEKKDSEKKEADKDKSKRLVCIHPPAQQPVLPCVEEWVCMYAQHIKAAPFQGYCVYRSPFLTFVFWTRLPF